MPITPQDIEHVASLSKLELAETEKQQVTEALCALSEHIQRLQEVDISQVEPTTHILALQNVFREDVLLPCLPREQALDLAPESEYGFFRVPSIL